MKIERADGLFTQNMMANDVKPNLCSAKPQTTGLKFAKEHVTEYGEDGAYRANMYKWQCWKLDGDIIWEKL